MRRSPPGSAKLSDAQAWQRAAINVGHNTSLARVTRIGTRKLGLPPRLERPARRRSVRRPALARGRLPDRDARATSRRSRTSWSTRPASSRPPTASSSTPQRRGARPREPRRQRGRDRLLGRPKARAAHPRPTTPHRRAAGRRTPGCDTPKGPFTVADGSTASARSTSSPTPTTRRNDIVLKLFRRRDRRSPSRTPSARPSASATRRTAASRRATTRPGVRVRGRRAAGRAAHLDRDDRARRLRRRPQPFTARWRAFTANPPLTPLAPDPWNNPSTDTRENLCWKQSTTPSDCDRVVGNPASRSPWDFDPQDRTRRRTRRAATTPARPSRGPTRPARARPVPPGQPDRDYSFPWTNEWFAQDCNPGTPTAPTFRSARASTSPRR